MAKKSFRVVYIYAQCIVYTVHIELMYAQHNSTHSIQLPASPELSS